MHGMLANRVSPVRSLAIPVWLGLLAVVGCATHVTPTPATSTGPTAAPGPTPPANEPPPTPAPAPVPANVDPPPAAIDPATLGGHVLSRTASQNLRGQLTARISAIETPPPADGMGTWRISLLDGAATTHQLEVQAPARLPAPLRVGDDVQVRVRPTGGGPNMRYALLFTATAGDLLLAVNDTPPDWKIVRGALASTDRGSDYTERRYGVIFEHAGVRLAVPADTWARMDIGDASYYVWGSAAQRKLGAGKRPMPDYVGAWLDLAIVRAR
jgi:hypothetical protein